MEIINEKHYVVKKVLCLQEYTKFDEYKLSPYVVIFPKDENQLWYNMLTGELILLSENELDNNDVYVKLVKHWYYINTNYNPKTIANIVSQLARNLIKNNDNSISNKYVVTSTYACNA